MLRLAAFLDGELGAPTPCASPSCVLAAALALALTFPMWGAMNYLGNPRLPLDKRQTQLRKYQLLFTIGMFSYKHVFNPVFKET